MHTEPNSINYPQTGANIAQTDAPRVTYCLRVAAAILDLIFCVILFWGLTVVASLFFNISHELDAWMGSSKDIEAPVPPHLKSEYSWMMVRFAMFLALYLMLVGSYHVAGEASVRRGSWGKRLLGLAVTDRNFKQISKARAVVRLVGKGLVLGCSLVFVGGPLIAVGFLVPGDLLVWYAGASIILIFLACFLRFSKNSAPLHDTLSGCRVIRRSALIH